MKMEEEQSKRLDRYVELDEKQVPFAQRSSFVLNALLIVLTAILAFNGKDLAAGMSLGSLVLINAASMYVQVRGLGDSKHSDDEDSED